jgi:protease-4
VSNRTTELGRLAVVGTVLVVVAAVGFFLFVDYPRGNLTRLAGVILLIASLAVALPAAGRLARNAFPADNVAEVTVEGPISRDGGQSSFPPTGPASPGADAIVDRIDAANQDDAIKGLLLHLNTPGGEIVPSDDIRRAAESFEGPVIAYTTDVCASGGYWIASACDELWAREASTIGSIGVRGSRVTAANLLERVGLSYEQFTAGEYKEAGGSLSDIDDDEREYLQGLIDGFYDMFVETVAEGRNMEAGFLRETEAKVFLGRDAVENGLVDQLGTREDVLARFETDLGPVSVRELTIRGGVLSRFRGGAASVAYALGAGLASAILPNNEANHSRFRF